MVSLFAFIESNGKSIVVLAFYHHDVIPGTKYKTTITPHIVPYKSRSLIRSQCLLRLPLKETLIADQ